MDTQAKIKKLLELVDELVNEEGVTWTEKRHRITREASDSDKTNLAEFGSWFVD
jgi:hypothetical protein